MSGIGIGIGIDVDIQNERKPLLLKRVFFCKRFWRWRFESPHCRRCNEMRKHKNKNKNKIK